MVGLPRVHLVFSNVLTHATWLAPLGLVLVVVGAPIAGLWLNAHRRVTGVLVVVAIVAVLGLTLSPQGFPSPSITCSWGWPFINSTPEKSIANALLFCPPHSSV